MTARRGLDLNDAIARWQALDLQYGPRDAQSWWAADHAPILVLVRRLHERALHGDSAPWRAMLHKLRKLERGQRVLSEPGTDGHRQRFRARNRIPGRSENARESA